METKERVISGGILEMLGKIRSRMGQVRNEFIVSGKAIDFRVGGFVERDALSVDVYSAWFKGGDEDECYNELDETCPSIYYEAHDEICHAYCIGVYESNGHFAMLLFDMGQCDFFVAYDFDVVQGLDYLLGTVETYLHSKKDKTDMTREEFLKDLSTRLPYGVTI